MKNSFTVAKFLTIALTLAIGAALWWIMRPSFIHDENAHGYCCNDETCSQSTIEQQPIPQPEVATSASSKPCCAELDTTKPCCALLGEKETATPTTKKKTSKPIPTVKVSAEITPPAQKSVAIPGKVMVTNGIEKKMLGYKKFGTHYPTTFKVTTGKDTIPQGGTCAVTPINNSLLVRYDFEFMNGYRNGAMEVTFNLKPGTDIITLNWDWKGEHRLFLAEADKVVSIVEKDIPYQK